MSGQPAVPLDRDLTYVTVEVADQLFGIPIGRVHDVFVVPGLTPVPLAPPEVAGLLNLRGRVVTAIDLRRRFDLPVSSDPEGRMAVGIDQGRDSYGFIVDAVGEVISLPAESFDLNPTHMSGPWAALSRGLHRLEGRLLVVMDVDAVLDPERAALAA